ncbi:MAG: glutamate--tRNA ligase family protein, partial [Alphaproteobacteria bacterium]
MSVSVRFAPSPTGHIHVGNVRMALFNWLYARANGGTFLLRLDDTDAERSTDAFAQGIRDDLNWLGLNFDDEKKQSDRTARYEEVRADLVARGLLYPCYETPEELSLKRKVAMQAGKPPVYDRAALNLSDDEKA